MRLLVAMVLLIPAITFGAEGDGRYQLLNTKEDVLIIDTKTGRAWNKVKGASPEMFIPEIFMCSDDKVAFLPTCENTKKLPIPSTVPQSIQ